MIYLDTHIVVWLYAGLLEKFNQSVVTLLNENQCMVSPIVRLELKYLSEIERVNVPPDHIIEDLAERISLTLCEKDFNVVIGRAIKMEWTRDPFDRIIVAQASLNDNILISKDQNILKNYIHARW